MLCDRISIVKKSSIFTPLTVLILGDVFTFAITTGIGFAFHETLGSASLRFLATFLPILAGWLLVAPALGVFDRDHSRNFRQLWRPVWATFLAAPLAAWLRGLWLVSVISPIFVLGLGGINMLAILIWRSLYIMAASRMMIKHG